MPNLTRCDFAYCGRVWVAALYKRFEGNDQIRRVITMNRLAMLEALASIRSACADIRKNAEEAKAILKEGTK